LDAEPDTAPRQAEADEGEPNAGGRAHSRPLSGRGHLRGPVFELQEGRAVFYRNLCRSPLTWFRLAPTDQGKFSVTHHLSRCYSRIMIARIRIEPGKRSGQPCVRGLRITVWDVLSWLAAGMTEREILDDYPELEPDDFPAVYDFAAHMGRRVAL